jgi:putative transcriptional regulator
MQTLKGHLLIAAPHLRSPIFTRSVILMIGQNEGGALGLILNQQISTTVTNLSGKIFVEDFDWDKPLSLGGPVASSLMMLHTNEDLADDEIIPGVYITADGSKVQELIEQRPEPSLVVANYSGWGPGQLDGELRADSWLTLPATVEHVFWTGEKELWNVVVNQVRAQELTALAGVRTLPPDPRLN